MHTAARTRACRRSGQVSPRSRNHAQGVQRGWNQYQGDEGLKESGKKARPPPPVEGPGSREHNRRKSRSIPQKRERTGPRHPQDRRDSHGVPLKPKRSPTQAHRWRSLKVATNPGLAVSRCRTKLRTTYPPYARTMAAAARNTGVSAGTSGPPAYRLSRVEVKIGQIGKTPGPGVGKIVQGRPTTPPSSGVSPLPPAVSG